MNRHWAWTTICGAAALALTACGGDVEDPSANDEATDGAADTAGETTGADEAGSEGEAPVDATSCLYASPFTSAVECRDYTGAAWTEADVMDACAALSGDYSSDPCGTTNVLGRCILDDGGDLEVQIVAYGTSPDACGDQQTGCEVFGGGTWEPEGLCEGGGGDDGGGDGGFGAPFEQPTLECRDPLPGEPPGDGPDGQVCTWQLISASTEEGRHYADYASCDVVYTQRPYYAAAPNTSEPEEDPRMDDPEYLDDLDWVRTQIQASACTCCHSNEAPLGAANWDIDAGGNWTRTFLDSGLAFGAGWIDSTSFGMYPPEENNGFDRSIGVPSTDPERMQAFFLRELEYRGKTEADFANAPPFGGPLYTQLVYEPESCENGEGVLSDGTIRWSGGDARYVYVLESGSGNPTVPPNLDMPDGILWRVDVPSEGSPLASESVRYGEIPSGTGQRFPMADAPPPPLESGREYYLYVTKDVIQPVTRCLFTYE